MILEVHFQNHEYLLITNCTRRSCDFLFIVYSTKLRSTNQSERGNSELFIYLLLSVRVYFRKPLKLFGPTSEIFETLRLNLGHLLNSSGQLRKSSEVFRSPSEIYGKVRKFSDALWSPSVVTPGEYNLG